MSSGFTCKVSRYISDAVRGYSRAVTESPQIQYLSWGSTSLGKEEIDNEADGKLRVKEGV